MRYAYLYDSVVAEIIDCDDVARFYHPDFVAQLVNCDDSVIVGMVHLDGKFVAPSDVKITRSEMIARQISSIDSYISDCIKTRDYDDIGQVALCCHDGNGYQVEALAISAWIKKCWHNQDKISSGEIEFNSVDEAIKDLPKFDILV